MGASQHAGFPVRKLLEVTIIQKSCYFRNPVISCSVLYGNLNQVS